MHEYKTLYSLFDWSPSFSGLLLPLFFLITGLLLLRWGWRSRKKGGSGTLGLYFVGIVFVGFPVAMFAYTNITHYQKVRKARALQAAGGIRTVEGPLSGHDRYAHIAEDQMDDSYHYSYFLVQGVRFEVQHNSIWVHVFGEPSVGPNDLKEGRRMRVAYYPEGKELVVVSIEADMRTPTAGDEARAAAARQEAADSAQQHEAWKEGLRDSVESARWDTIPQKRADSMFAGFLPYPPDRTDAIMDSLLKARKPRP